MFQSVKQNLKYFTKPDIFDSQSKHQSVREDGTKVQRKVILTTETGVIISRSTRISRKKRILPNYKY